MKTMLSIDNIYPIGIPVTAKVNPTLKLVIDNYFQRIYYCSIADDPDHKPLLYFERELIAPPEYSFTPKTGL
jgi:hypothetical protein